jgi:hypothetical protein
MRVLAAIFWGLLLAGCIMAGLLLTTGLAGNFIYNNF